MTSGVSMEAFGPISVDYFNGRRVDAVREGDGTEGAPVWSIEYEGSGFIHNYDPTLSLPTAIVGAAQTLVVLGGKQVLGYPTTELRFGLEVVHLNPMQYAIEDETYTRGQIVFAQRSQANMPRPVDPSDERVKDRPDGED